MKSAEPKAMNSTGSPPQTRQFFSLQEVDNILNLIKAFEQNPKDDGIVAQLGGLRDKLRSYVQATTSEPDLLKLFGTNFAIVFRHISRSGIVDITKIGTDYGLFFWGVDEKEFKESPCQTCNILLSRMLSCRAHLTNPLPELTKVPEWLHEVYVDYLLYSPQVFFRKGEAAAFLSTYRKALHWILDYMLGEKGPQFINKFGERIIKSISIIPAYFNDDNLKDLMSCRAEICSLIFNANGYRLSQNIQVPAKPRARTRIGVLDPDVSYRTETYASLPLLHLDKSRYEIILFSFYEITAPALLNAVTALVDKFVVLPSGIHEMATAVRSHDLDILIFGTNICAVTSLSFQLAAHRLARYQIASYCSPITTGLKTIDGFISGTLSSDENNQEDFTEQLIRIPGAPGCLDFSNDTRKAVATITRKALAIPEDQLIFVSASNCFKILPEIQETWIKILKAVTNARLFLHPFNPNWSSKYPQIQFRDFIFHMCLRHGISPLRVTISDIMLPTRADVKSLLGIGDIYLDTFPYSGSVSLSEALEAGLPTIVCKGKSLRSRQGAALLYDLDIPELICESEDEYIGKAIHYARNEEARHKVRTKIQHAMANKPRFEDADAYAIELDKALMGIMGK